MLRKNQHSSKATGRPARSPLPAGFLRRYNSWFIHIRLFAGQNVELWPIDEGVSDSGVSVLAVSDFNRALAMQGKEPVTLTENQCLLNCNYKGTFPYVEKALENHADLVLAGIPLHRASDTVLEETYFMTSVGNNDRGTLIVPDAVVHSLRKDVNVLLVQYRPDVGSDAILQKMIPIGLHDTHGYRYAENYRK